MDYMDVEAMATLLTPKMEGNVPTIICEEPSGLPTFIIPTMGTLSFGLGTSTLEGQSWQSHHAAPSRLPPPLPN
nr:hypothetical protein CFP56_27611 [Quercus suber]